jgi:hypothetical protein
VQNRRTGLHGLERIEDRRQLFVFDLDQVQRFLRSLATLSGDRRHFVAHVAHLVPAQNRNVADAFALIVVRLVFPGHDRFNALDLPRFRGINVFNPRMRIGAS